MPKVPTAKVDTFDAEVVVDQLLTRFLKFEGNFMRLEKKIDSIALMLNEIGRKLDDAKEKRTVY